MNIAVVILAGGEGSRIGGNKPLRRLGGKRLIDRAQAQAEQWSQIVAIAVRVAGQVGRSELTCISDVEGIEGPLSGLAAGLNFAGDAGCEAVLTIPADMPFLPADLRDQLAAGIGSAAAAIASSGGRLHPVCGLWRVSASEAIPDYLMSGRRSLKGFAEAIGSKVAEWAHDSRDPFFNINSAEDLAYAERLLED